MVKEKFYSGRETVTAPYLSGEFDSIKFHLISNEMDEVFQVDFNIMRRNILDNNCKDDDNFFLPQ
jgi:hypothetical protein